MKQATQQEHLKNTMPPKKEKGKKRKELPTAFLPDTPAWPTSEGTQPPAPRGGAAAAAEQRRADPRADGWR